MTHIPGMLSLPPPVPGREPQVPTAAALRRAGIPRAQSRESYMGPQAFQEHLLPKRVRGSLAPDSSREQCTFWEHLFHDKFGNETQRLMKPH